MLTPHTNVYRRPLDDHPGDAGLNGIGIYFDNEMLRPVRALMTWDKSFVDAISVDEKNSKNAGTSNFRKRYPYHEPLNSLLETTAEHLKVSCSALALE